MFSCIQAIAERKIQQAITDGTLPDLSHWKNKPLPPDDLAGVPADLRRAYRLLKNAGYVPEEVAMHREINRLEELLPQCADEREKIRQLRRIACLRTRLENRTGRSLQLGEDGEYYGRVVDRLSTPRR